MISPRSFLDSEQRQLATSLDALANFTDGLELGKGAQLRVLAQRLLPSQGQQGHELTLEQALAVVRQARSTPYLLAGSGHRDDELSGTLTQALDDAKGLMGSRLRSGYASKIRGLYVIIDPEVTSGRNPVEIARAALSGGAQILQLRDKLREKGETLTLAHSLKDLCTEFGATLIINDHADLASVVGADGLHVGQGDLPVAEARRILQPWQVIGRSNHRPGELEDSQAQGADHVAFGAMYATSTKVSKETSIPVGPEGLRAARASVKVPLVAIGGINENNIEAVVRAGADSVCVTAAIGLADDPEGATRRLVRRIEGAGEKI